MLAFALLPLILYLVFLTALHFRRTPTVLNGSLDFTLLAWGLFGLITLGPGRLIIPLYVFAAWGIYTWIFWLGFYFLTIHALSVRYQDRFVVYHGRRELVLPALFTLAQKIDPKTEWSGHVLSLHGLGIQWAVTYGKYGGHLLFVPTSPLRKNPHREMLQQQLANLCQTLEMPKNRIRWFWFCLTVGLFCFMIYVFIYNASMLFQLFNDYWLPYQ